MILTFTVYGVAQPKGSMRAFQPRGMHFPIVTESNKSVRGWQQLVAEGASRAIGALDADARGVLTAGVRLSVVFYLPRPKALLKRGLPIAHLKKPDLDKLTRAVNDALKGVVYQDDSQLIELLARKVYADVDDVPHVDLRVEPTTGYGSIHPPAAPLPLFEIGDAR